MWEMLFGRCRILLLWSALTCLGAWAPGVAQTIDMAKHDLRAEVPRAAADRESEVCVFCHGRLAAGVAPPSWHPTGRTEEFRTFDTLSAGGDMVSGEAVSLMCLSCHDGSQAPDVAILMQAAPAAETTGGAFSLSGTSARADQLRIHSFDPRLEHPVGVPFGGDRGADVGPSRFASNLRTAQIGGKWRWWIDTEKLSNGRRDKTDIILFTRGDETGATPYVECASCHDPHSGQPAFLRFPAELPSPCAVCHPM